MSPQTRSQSVDQDRLYTSSLNILLYTWICVGTHCRGLPSESSFIQCLPFYETLQRHCHYLKIISRRTRSFWSSFSSRIGTSISSWRLRCPTTPCHASFPATTSILPTAGEQSCILSLVPYRFLLYFFIPSKSMAPLGRSANIRLKTFRTLLLLPSHRPRLPPQSSSL
jgi:hypothetical protein